MTEREPTISPNLAEAERRIAEATTRGSDRLALNGLGLKTLPALPRTLHELRGLNLSGNRLKNLSSDVAALAQLEWLDLGNNRFECLPPEICGLTQLASLDLSENRLSQLSSAIGALSNLTELSLYHNHLREIPETLLSLAKLKRLDLAANKLSLLTAFDRRLSRLEVLDLSRNDLSAVPAGLDQLIGLRALNLSGNRLTSTNGIGALDLLDELDVSRNLLGEPPLAALKLKRLRVLEAEGNPFGPLPATYRGLAAADIKTRASAAVANLVSGGMQEGKTYFEPVSFVFECVVALGGLTGVLLAIDRLYKRFDNMASVVLAFPTGTRVALAHLSHKRALEIAREHEAELMAGEAQLDFGRAANPIEVERAKSFAVDVLARVPGSSLVPKVTGAMAQQFNVYNGPIYNPVMLGPSAKEETMGDKITISDVHDSIINVKSKLQQVTQTINAAPIDPDRKEELKALVGQLDAALEKVPSEKRQDSEAVAEIVKDTMDKVAQPEPNKKTLELSLKGMLEAAKGLTDALPVAAKLAAAVAGIFGLTL